MIAFLSLVLLTFPAIADTIPDGPFSYPGLYSREVIVVDPENSPLLENAYLDLKSQLHETFTEKDILQTTLLYVRENLFDLELCTDQNVIRFLLQFMDKGPEIPLETFLEKKIGVCRHLALTTTYLLERLTKDRLLDGKAYLIREQIPSGRHGWTLFLSQSGAWHLDSYWEILENGKTDAGFFHLCQKYGKRTMERQQLRWQNVN
ncbi:MAG: hypothetical protein K1000chlam2_00733 [Chlamydiae bacterium]|nr:hypothetical protein [Chlamydiota bacterium]